ncbi:Rid family detoxifying hydrolase [Halorubrum rubrum]|uniref:Rid family detoxifying hydrolase n=1 Tax=Halorubrum rubrum TaxID=1126240 RepID=A0ABD5QZA8_9EURY|nr:Rid family detoxifying hydrolase [Halorubrum rubrum]
MTKIDTNDAPASIGPFSQGLGSGDWVFTSGQGPTDPATGKVVSGDLRVRTERTSENASAVLKTATCSLPDIVKTTVVLRSVTDDDVVNDVDGEHVSDLYPARSTGEVVTLSVDVDVEIEVVAERGHR